MTLLAEREHETVSQLAVRQLESLALLVILLANGELDKDTLLDHCLTGNVKQ